ncbi:MAG: adenylate kinase [Proteobacteria bacterium]|nr:adenylate kinase [Pseudomonadota bacterium]
MNNIIFLGAPGSGKGTQASLLSKSLNIPTISTGEILRKEVSNGSEVGILAKSYMDSGSLVPDEVVIKIIENRIVNSDCNDGFILDGFPRNLDQALMLEKALASIGKEIDKVIYLSVPDDIIVKRISGRFSCKSCGEVYNQFFKSTIKNGVCDKCGSTDFESRSDDNEATVINRLKVYNKNTKAMFAVYEKKGLIYKVDGLKNIARISEDILSGVSN